MRPSVDSSQYFAINHFARVSDNCLRARKIVSIAIGNVTVLSSVRNKFDEEVRSWREISRWSWNCGGSWQCSSRFCPFARHGSLLCHPEPSQRLRWTFRRTRNRRTNSRRNSCRSTQRATTLRIFRRGPSSTCRSIVHGTKWRSGIAVGLSFK